MNFTTRATLTGLLLGSFIALPACAAPAEFPGGVSATTSADAHLKFLGQKKGVTQLQLTSGSAHLAVPANTQLKLQAGSLTCQAKGAEAEVALDAQGRPSVSALSGVVGVTDAKGQHFRLNSGWQLSMGADGVTPDVHTRSAAAAPAATPAKAAVAAARKGPEQGGPPLIDGQESASLPPAGPGYSPSREDGAAAPSSSDDGSVAPNAQRRHRRGGWRNRTASADGGGTRGWNSSGRGSNSSDYSDGSTPGYDASGPSGDEAAYNEPSPSRGSRRGSYDQGSRGRGSYNDSDPGPNDGGQGYDDNGQGYQDDSRNRGSGNRGQAGGGAGDQIMSAIPGVLVQMLPYVMNSGNNGYNQGYNNGPYNNGGYNQGYNNGGGLFNLPNIFR